MGNTDPGRFRLPSPQAGGPYLNLVPSHSWQLQTWGFSPFALYLMHGEREACGGPLLPEVLFIPPNHAKADEFTDTYTHMCAYRHAYTHTHTCNAFAIYNTTSKQAFSLFRTQENQEVGHKDP